jgi:hypothetical protein
MSFSSLGPKLKVKFESTKLRHTLRDYTHRNAPGDDVFYTLQCNWKQCF